MQKVHITLLGKETLPIYYLVKKECYDRVFILATEQNKPIAKRLKSVLSTESMVCKVVIVNAFDVNDTINACEDIHSSLNIDSEVTYNVTGGTKLMAIGAYNVARSHDARIVYTNSASLVDLTTFKSVPLSVSVDSKTIFALQGQELKDYIVYAKDNYRLDCSHKIMQFIESHKDLYKRLRRLYDEHKCNGMVFTHFSNNEAPIFEYKKGHIQAWDNGNLALDIANVDSMSLLFEGRWWETLVVEAISQWTDGRFEVWTNVKFSPHDTNLRVLDKNEIDILVNTGNKLLIVECKSGMITQDNINKMSVIRQTYGSDKSMSVLISYFPVRQDLFEKAHEAKLNIIKNLGDIPSRLDKILISIKA